MIDVNPQYAAKVPRMLENVVDEILAFLQARWKENGGYGATPLLPASGDGGFARIHGATAFLDATWHAVAGLALLVSLTGRWRKTSTILLSEVPRLIPGHYICSNFHISAVFYLKITTDMLEITLYFP
jgi:hypothetical protein